MLMKANDSQLTYSVEQFAEQTSLSKIFLRTEIAAGRLKARKLGRRVLIMRDDAMQYLNDRTTPVEVKNQKHTEVK